MALGNVPLQPELLKAFFENFSPRLSPQYNELFLEFRVVDLTEADGIDDLVRYSTFEISGLVFQFR